MGLPPPICSVQQTAAIQDICNEYKNLLPVTFRVSVEILRIVSISTTQLEAIEDRTTHLSMTQMFDSQYDQIMQTHQEIWTPELEVDLQSARLFLYGMTFILPESKVPDGTSQTMLFTELILRQGLAAATALTTSMSKLSAAKLPAGDDAKHPAGVLTFYPVHYFTSLFFAVTFILHYVACARSATDHDRVQAIASLTEAHKLFQSFPRSRDLMRAASHMEVLASTARTGRNTSQSQSSELFIKDRLGVSVMFDAAFRSAIERNRNPISGHVESATTWKSLNDILTLPPTPDQVAIALREASLSAAVASIPSQVDSWKQDEMTLMWGPWDAHMAEFGVGPESLGLGELRESG